MATVGSFSGYCWLVYECALVLVGSLVWLLFGSLLFPVDLGTSCIDPVVSVGLVWLLRSTPWLPVSSPAAARWFLGSY